MSIFCIGIYIIFVNYKFFFFKKKKKLFQQCSIKQVPDTFQVSKPMITSTSYGKIEATDPGGLHLGPVYITLEKCIWRSRSLAQYMVIGGKEDMPEKMKRQSKYVIKIAILRMSSFLSEALRLPKKPDLRRTPLLKSVRQVGIHDIFSSMYNVLHQRTLGCSESHHRTRVLLLANQILEFPIIHDRWSYPPYCKPTLISFDECCISAGFFI